MIQSTEKMELDESEDRQLIQRAYRKLLRTMQGKMDSDDQKLMRQAYELAVKAHEQQRRKSGEPYILHPIEVARICSEEIGLGPTAVICALLHDVVEDTDVTLKELGKIFGERIMRIVDGLTKLEKESNSATPQAENFKKVLSTLVHDVRVVLIKMADRLHNLRTIGSMPRHKQVRIAAETLYIYAPLAHRLGLYAIKSEFQDLCLKINEPEDFFDIARKLSDTLGERTRYINDFIKPLSTSLDELGYSYRITGRPKSIYSIWNKIKNKNVQFEEIYDLFAIRIIVDVPRTKERPICWEIYSIVTDVHRPIPERLKDWITTPKSNGYESLHTTVIGQEGRRVEVQIRSERMDEIAERGFAAHWKYKGVNGQPDVYDAWLDNIREILDNKDTDALEFLSDFKSNLFKEEVYVYTPMGDMRVLPASATALDFAFSIHSNVGYHCSHIKVNNKLEPMGYKLQNGDLVQITTNKNQKPTEDWLKMVVTGKARARIRSALKEDRKKQAEFGKEAVQRKFDHLKVDYEPAMEVLVRYYDFKSFLDLNYEISMETLKINDLLRPFKVENGRLVEIPVEKALDKVVEVPQEKVSPTSKAGKSGLLINNVAAEQYEFSLASCCNPVQGDDVYGFLTTGSGVKIHRNNCPNASHMMSNYGYRVVKADWTNTAGGVFVSELLIIGVDEGIGVIERISNLISSKLGIDIRKFSISGKERFFEGHLTLMVSNTGQLNLIINELKNQSYISSVTRVENKE